MAMKIGALLRYGVLVGVGMMLCGQAEARPVNADDFPFSAPLEGRPGLSPVKVALPSEILSRCGPGTANVRVYDDLGKEVPFLIDTVREPGRQFSRWDIVRSQDMKEGAAFLLGNPEGAGFVNNLQIIADRRPCLADIEVYAAATPWRLIAKGKVADLRPSYNAYRMGIDFPETLAAQLKVILKRPAVEKGPGPTACSPFDDALQELNPLSGIRGFAVLQGKGTGPGLDEEVFEGLPCSRDDQGDTVIDVGRVGLPVEEVSIRAADGCFYREVEIHATDSPGEPLYRSRGSGAVYRIPRLDLGSDVIRADVAKAHLLRIRIMNKNASPLAVGRVSIRWARRYLLFVPQPGRSYVVCYGSAQIPGAQYVPDWKARYGGLAGLPGWKVGRSSPNADYEPERLAKEQFKRFFFIGVVILLAYFIGFWIIRIRDLLPRR